MEVSWSLHHLRALAWEIRRKVMQGGLLGVCRRQFFNVLISGCLTGCVTCSQIMVGFIRWHRSWGSTFACTVRSLSLSLRFSHMRGCVRAVELEGILCENFRFMERLFYRA